MLDGVFLCVFILCVLCLLKMFVCVVCKRVECCCMVYLYVLLFACVCVVNVNVCDFGVRMYLLCDCVLLW